MLVALDVDYMAKAEGETGRCGVVAFEEWTSVESTIELSIVVNDVRPYVSGRLFERELPCLLAGIDALVTAHPDLELSCILIDGNVRLDQHASPGLGMYLYRHFDEAIPVVGIAKNAYKDLDAVEVLRGASTKPLYVTAAGINENQAAGLVRTMAGEFRLPTLIRRADHLARSRATS